VLTTVRSARTDELSDLELTELRTLVFLGFGEGRFSTDDWEHGLGGMHFIGSVAGAAVAHASVVPRELRVDGRAVHTGYVEAVAVAEEHRRKGYGHSVMAEAGRHIEATYELGALSAAEHNQPFYRRLGWRIWPGPLAVDLEGGRRPTPEEEGGVMVLQTSRTGRLELHATLSCDWRAGDVW
jgi:aminoglycoside 2'-N-acetyltransferase I